MEFDSRTPLEKLMAVAEDKYPVAFEPVTVGGKTLEILQIKDMQAHIERLAEQAHPTEGIELPFWAKIWPASMILSYLLINIDPVGKKALEIGAGVGVTGLFAAAHGFSTVISDVSNDALLFTQINVLKNGLEDKAKVVRADFSKTDLGEKFDYILGAEVLYRPDTYRGLVKFLLKHLKRSPKSEAILAREYSRKSERFIKLATAEFTALEKNIGSKSENNGNEDDERHLTTIHRLRLRKHV